MKLRDLLNDDIVNELDRIDERAGVDLRQFDMVFVQIKNEINKLEQRADFLTRVQSFAIRLSNQSREWIEYLQAVGLSGLEVDFHVTGDPRSFDIYTRENAKELIGFGGAGSQEVRDIEAMFSKYAKDFGFKGVRMTGARRDRMSFYLDLK